MAQQIRRRWLMGAMLPLVAGAALFAGRLGPAAAQPGPMEEPMQGHSLEHLTGDAFDQAFLQEMIRHHAMAVMMAEPVAANAPHQELRDQAAAIIADQTREIGEMRQWLREWYGIETPDPLAMMAGMQGGSMPMTPGGGMGGGAPGHEEHGGPATSGQALPGMPGAGHPQAGASGMGMMDMEMMMNLGALPPERLEVVFMSMMITHHEDAVEMARLVPDRTAHAELAALANDIVRTQTAEIDHFNHWLREWYAL